MEFVGFVLYMIVVLFILGLYGGKFNVAWIFCFICAYRCFAKGVEMYSIPASIFAIAGAIINLKGDDKKNDQN